LRDPSEDVVRGAEERLARELETVHASDGPIVVGPWLSEVGIELLYWVPFLRRLVARHGLDPARLVAVSRGGVASWYSMCGSYVDVFDLVGEDEFRKALAAGWAEQDGQKQWNVGAFDRRVLTLAAERLGAEVGAVLHPSVMFTLFSEYWRDRISLARVLPYLQPAPFDPPAIDRPLPERYTAIRFYFRETFPDTDENRALVASIVARLARVQPVVALDTDVEIDDHRQVPLPPGVEVLKPLAGVAAAENLELQGAVLARADAFVGTYGGLCYLANAYGVPAVALRAPAATGLSHTAVARRISAATGGHLSIVSTTALEPR
jgi:hypothetical protein